MELLKLSPIAQGYRKGNQLRSLLDNRVKIRNGMPSVKKMKEGQSIYCKIKGNIYNIIKHKGTLYQVKYAETTEISSEAT